MTRLRVAAHNANDQAAAVQAATEHADLILWSEAVPASLPEWTTVRGGKGVITGWRTDLGRHIDTKWHEAHKGSALIPTPARGSLVTCLQLPDDSLLGIVNGHRINGTGWPGARKRHAWERRRDLWRQHDAMDRELIAGLLAKGYSTILGADVNRVDMPAPHPDAVPLRNGGITQLWLIPGAKGPRLTPGKGGSVPSLATGTSHRLQWSDLTPTKETP